MGVVLALAILVAVQLVIASPGAVNDTDVQKNFQTMFCLQCIGEQYGKQYNQDFETDLKIAYQACLIMPNQRANETDQSANCVRAILQQKSQYAQPVKTCTFNCTNISNTNNIGLCFKCIFEQYAEQCNEDFVMDISTAYNACQTAPNQKNLAKTNETDCMRAILQQKSQYAKSVKTCASKCFSVNEQSDKKRINKMTLCLKCIGEHHDERCEALFRQVTDFKNKLCVKPNAERMDCIMAKVLRIAECQKSIKACAFRCPF